MRGRISDIFVSIFFFLLDGIGIIGSFVLAVLIRENTNFLLTSQEAQPMGILILAAHLVVAVFSKAYKDMLIRGKFVEARETVKHVLITIAVAFIFKYLLHIEFVISRMIIGLTLAFAVFILYFVRVLFKRLFRKLARESVNIQKVLVVGNKDKISDLLNNIGELSTYHYRVVGLAIMDEEMTGQTYEGLTVVASKDSLMEFASVNELDCVYFDISMGDVVGKSLVQEFIDMGIVVTLSMDRILQEYPNGQFTHLGKSEVLSAKAKKLTDGEIFAKRMLDIVGGLVGSLLTIVLTIFIAPVLFIKSPGPIFFAQTRVGLNGRKFKIIKFRSMYPDAEKRKAELMKQNQMQGLMFKMDNDPRIIKGIGHFLRNSSLDEFPQFFNVLMGDMSLVGTRPPTVDEYEQYTPLQKSRLSMKPGITGLWQVSGRSDITDFDEIVKLDRKYINNWSFSKDLIILGKTFGVVFTRKGAK